MCVFLIASILLMAVFTTMIVNPQKRSFDFNIYSDINRYTNSENFLSDLKLNYTIVNSKNGSRKEYGKRIFFRPDGSRISESNYVDSQLNGSYIEWDENEVKKLEETWKNNQKQGIATSYSSTGKVIAQGTYQNGQPWDGTFRLPGGHRKMNPYIWTISTYKNGKLVDEIPEN